MQHYLSVICSVIEKKDYFENNNESRINKIFSFVFYSHSIISNVLKTDNQAVARKCIDGFKILTSIHKVELKKRKHRGSCRS